MVDHRISTGLICYAHLFFVIKQLETKHTEYNASEKKKEKERKKSKPAHLLLTLSGCCLEL